MGDRVLRFFAEARLRAGVGGCRGSGLAGRRDSVGALIVAIFGVMPPTLIYDDHGYRNDDQLLTQPEVAQAVYQVGNHHHHHHHHQQQQQQQH